MSAGLPVAVYALFLLSGLALLAWSSDLFVDGSAALAKILGISPFVVGMVVIGFGTSAPELCVSVLSGFYGHANLSVGNAYGSCIFNIAVILGVAALIFPLRVRPVTACVAGAGLAAISLFSIFVLRDGSCSRAEGVVFLSAFAVLLPLYCWFDQKTRGNAPDGQAEGAGRPARGWRDGVGAAVKIVVGLVVLVGSSHCLVWGAVDFAKLVGASDLVIGLTIVAIGTSLPELASAVASARRGEHEFVLGNVIGSNMFNTLAVVGLATVISPADDFSPYILRRDLPFMAALSFSILVFGRNWRRRGEDGAIGRRQAAAWLLSFAAYTVIMLYQELAK